MPTSGPPLLALLRGVNVGGQNVISRADLIRCFEDLGFTSVRTYIQSGNVLFRAAETRVADLTRAIEAASGGAVWGRRCGRSSFRGLATGPPSARRPPPGAVDDDRKHNALFTPPRCDAPPCRGAGCRC